MDDMPRCLVCGQPSHGYYFCDECREKIRALVRQNIDRAGSTSDAAARAWVMRRWNAGVRAAQIEGKAGTEEKE